MGFWDDISPEQRALIKGREKVPKHVAARIMGIKRDFFDKAYVEPGLIRGFVVPGYKMKWFYVRDLFEIRVKEHEIAKEEEEEKERLRTENKFTDDYFENLFQRAKMLTSAELRRKINNKQKKKEKI